MAQFILDNGNIKLLMAMAKCILMMARIIRVSLYRVLQIPKEDS